MPKNKFYLTTPIYYVNDKPHLGHAYTTIAGDVLARYHRLRGQDVYYLTGTDENSQKGVLAAAKAGEPDIQQYVNRLSAIWQETFDSLNLSHNDFIRTTETRHLKAVETFFKLVNDKGDIYRGTYVGWYCVGCEAFISENEAGDNKSCPIHQQPLEKIEEENYFFKASNYKKALLAHIKKTPGFIQPPARRNEVIAYIKDHFTDVSISRQSVKWGIPLPVDRSQVIYVCFDSLINYLTSVGFGADEEKFKKYWPADLHLLGKDIIKFHCALWPTMLMSAGLPLPKKVFAHGFFTINGQKMSKSLCNIIDPVALVSKYGNDALRYYLLVDFPFGDDGDFSLSRFDQRYHHELAHGLGNLMSRVMTMAAKYFNGVVPEKTAQVFEIDWSKYEAALDNLAFHEAFQIINKIIQQADRFIDEHKPWALAKKVDPML